MKKVIGVLSVAIFTVALFANTNSINNKEDINLEALLSQNTASAESSGWSGTKCVGTLTTCYFKPKADGTSTAVKGVRADY